MPDFQRQIDELQNDFRNHRHSSNGEAYVEEAPKKPVNYGAMTAHTVIFNELNKYFNPATYEVKAVLDAIQAHKSLFFPELDNTRNAVSALTKCTQETLLQLAAEPVDHHRRVIINGNNWTIAEALQHWQKDLNESEARARRIEQLEKRLGIHDK